MSGTGIFTLIDNFINGQVGNLVKVTQTNLSDSISTILMGSLTLYFIVYGYMVIAEKISVPFKTLLWKMASFVIIIAFMKNAGGILVLSGEAVSQLSTIGSDGEAGLKFLDDQYIRMFKLADRLWDKGNVFTGAVGFLGVMLAWGLCTIPIFSILVISKFTLFLLLGFAPVFIFCLMWGWLKQSFNNYLTALLSNALIILVIRTIQKGIVDFFDKLGDVNTDVSVALIGVLFVGVAWVLWYLYIYIIAIVSRLMATTVDQFPARSILSQSKQEGQQQQFQQQQLHTMRELTNQLKMLNSKNNKGN